MFFPALFLFPIASGLLVPPDPSQNEVESMCDKNPHYLCRPKVDFPGYPETKEEADSLCVILKENEACTLNYMENCGKDRFMGSAQIIESRIVSKLCGDDTSLYEAFIAHAKCIGNVFQNIETRDSCHNMIRRKYEERGEIYEKIVELVGSDPYEEKNLPLLDCLDQGLTLGCYVQKISSECGPGAKRLATQVIEQGNILRVECDEVDLLIVEDILRELDLSIKEENPLEVLLK